MNIKSQRRIRKWVRATDWEDTRGSLTDFLRTNKAPRGVRKLLKVGLRELERHKNPLVSQGLIREQLVTYPRWGRLALSIARKKNRNPLPLIRRWASRSLFEGPSAEVPNGKTLGRVCDEPRLLASLPEEIPLTRREEIVRLYPDPCNQIAEIAKRDLPFGNYALWATFSENNSNPFDFIRSSPDPVATAIERLALNDKPKPGHVWWFLTYNCLPADKTRIPTIVEACAGKVPDWNENFSPTAQDPPRFGQTCPPTGIAGLPEIVHPPIQVGDIQSHQKEIAR